METDAVIDISIHAPTRGATKAMMDNFGISGISIHAPTRGATQYHMHPKTVHHISIHAPTRGATVWFRPTAINQLDFNPRSHKGSDWTGERR